MGYFDALTKASFKPDADGNTVFFPYGAWGKGRLIADADSAEQLKKFVGRFIVIALAVPFIVGQTVGYIWSFIAFPFFTSNFRPNPYCDPRTGRRNHWPDHVLSTPSAKEME